MASPFAVFRKHQALLLVVFGVLIIVVFTIGDSVSRMASDGGGEQRDEVVVRWDGTKLKQSRLQGIQLGRRIAQSSLVEVQNAAMQKGAFPQFQQQLAFMRRINPQGAIRRPQMIFSGDDLSPLGTVRSMVLAARAQAMGMVVPDTQVQKYLLEVSDGKLTYQEIREILLGGKNSRYPQSMKSVFEVLRQEILADKLFSEFIRGTIAMPAAQQLDYFSRSHRQIEAEVIEIPVRQFIDQVPNPSEQQLQVYFNKYKFQTPLFDNIGGIEYQSADPGFKMPHRVSVEYVKVGLDEVLAKVQDEVSEEEVLAYYEEHKRRDEQMHAADDLPLPDPDSLDQADSAQEGHKEGSSANESAVPGSDRADAKQTGPQDTGPQEKAPDEPPAQGGETDSSRSSREISLHFVHFSAPESEQEKKSPPPLIEANIEANKEAGSGEGNASDSGDENASEGENVAKPDASQAGATETPKSGSDQEARFKEPKYKPLDEVRDYIRQRVAAEKANAIIDAKFAAIRKRMNSFAAARQYADEDGIAIIKRPNFSELADQQGLRADSVQLRSAWYFQRDTDIGRSFQRQPRSQFNPYGSQQPYVDIVFGQMGEQSWWNAVETIDDENFRYLSWKTDEALTETPKLEGAVREAVVRAWKEGSGRTEAKDTARFLARQRGEELAKALRGGATVAEVAAQQAGSRQLTTEAFSWLTSGSAPLANQFSQSRLRLSEIDGIDQAGPDFMQAAFVLEVGDVGVAMNHPQTHMYMIRITFQNKNSEVIQEDFLSHLEDPRTQQQIRSAAQLDWQLLSERWFDEINRSINLVWLNPAARFSR
jgi:hypothetical protein